MNIEQQAKAFIKAKGWTQEQLAAAVGIHHITLCRILNGQQKPSAREKLASYLESQRGLASPCPHDPAA